MGAENIGGDPEKYLERTDGLSPTTEDKIKSKQEEEKQTGKAVWLF